jgi:phosphoglycolate phosphatase
MIDLSVDRMGFRGIVLDLDGTLVDTVPDACAALNSVFVAEGLGALSLAEVRTTVGEGLRAMLIRALSLRGLTNQAEATIKNYTDRYMANYLADPVAHTTIYPGVRETIDVLHRSGFMLGICTNKPRISTHLVLDRLFPERPFTAILCPEDVQYCKPDGRHVIATLEQMGVGTADCIMVGDSETDIAAAVNAHIPAIAVSYGYCHVPIETLPAAAVIDHFADLPAALTRIASQRGSK